MNAVPRVVLLAVAAIVIAGCGSHGAKPSQSSSGQPGDNRNGAGQSQSQYYQQGYTSGTSGLARTGYADQLARPGATVPEMEHNACSAAIDNEPNLASITDGDHPGNLDDYMNGCLHAFTDHHPPTG